MSIIRFFVLAIMAGLLLAPGLAAADGSDLEQVMIGWARTPEQHEALAEHFQAKAEEAQKEAARHKEMGKRYRGQHMAMAKQQQKHCGRLAELHETLADEYEALAKNHEEESKK